MLVVCINYDLLNIWTILLFGLAVSTATSFSSPAQQAILTQVAGGEIQKAVTASTALMFLVQIFSIGFARKMDNVGLSTVLTWQSRLNFARRISHYTPQKNRTITSACRRDFVAKTDE